MIKTLLLYGIFLTNIIYAQQDKDRGYIVEIGQPSPVFSIDKTNGEIFNLENHIGKVIMIQFTASWCSVCLKEMPFIETDIWQKHKDNNDFLLIGLAKDDIKRKQDIENIEYMQQKTQATYPIEIDKNGDVFKLFAGERAGVTRNIIINRKGEIAYLTRLFDHTEFEEMKKVINELLENKD